MFTNLCARKVLHVLAYVPHVYKHATGMIKKTNDRCRIIALYQVNLKIWKVHWYLG